jgi:hypothetical protein
MRRVVFTLLIGSLLLGGLALPAEAGGWHHRRHTHRRHHRHHHGHFAGGFVAGAATVLAVDALRTPRVIYAPPLVYRPVYYRAPVCRNDWIPGRWELQSRTQNGFASHYQVWVDGYWQRYCH